MQADEALVSYIASTYYNIAPVLGSIKRLPGYDDRNFLLTDSADNKTYVLKIVNRQESIRELTDILDEILAGAHEYCQTRGGRARDGHFVVPKQIKTTGDKLSTYTTVKYKRPPGRATSDGDQRPASDQQVAGGGARNAELLDEFEEVKCNIRLCEYFDGVTMTDYINGRSPPGLPALKTADHERLYFRLGQLCNQLFVYLRGHVHLIDKLRAVRARGEYPWLVGSCEKFIRQNLEHLYPDGHPRRSLVERVLDEFNATTKLKLGELPEFILHSDLSNNNILLAAANVAGSLGTPGGKDTAPRDKVCLIDFQDMQVGPRVIELAVMILYNVLEQQHTPLERALTLIPRWIHLGHQASTSCPLDPDEMLLVPSLMKLRLCQSLLNGLVAIEREPDNAYVMQTNQRGWRLLELMSDASSTLGKPHELVGLWLKVDGPQRPAK